MLGDSNAIASKFYNSNWVTYDPMVVTIRISKQRRIFFPNCISNTCHSHSLLRDFDYNCCKKYAVYCLYNIIPSIYSV